VKQGVDIELILEPGRMIAGNAGIMLANVEYIKERDGRTFVILDAGMNDLARPALYDSVHEILPLNEAPENAPIQAVDVVGPVCETTDRFEAHRKMPPLAQDDKIAFMSAGAYGAVLSSQYNARPLAAEVLVKGDSFEVIRPRPTYDDIIALEKTPSWLEA
jgi:diaminopimelate decarboxylase